MSNLHRSSHVLGTALLLTCLHNTGCKKKSLPPVLAPAGGLQLTAPDNNRTQLMATIMIASVERTVKAAAAIATTLQMPTSTEDLRSMMVARSGLPTTLLDHLDLARPIGIAVIGRDKGSSPWTAAATSATSAEAATKFIAAVGQKVGQKDDAIHVKRPDGQEMWIVARGKELVASDSLEALVAAGAHAQAAAAATKPDAADDVMATVYPEAMARAEGTDLKSAVEKLRDQAASSMANPMPGTPAPPVNAKFMQAYMATLFDFVVPWALDSETAEIFLRVSETDGVRLGGRVNPKAGSGLAKQIADRQPATIDPALLAGPPPAALFAAHYSDALVESLMKIYDALAKLEIKGVAELATAAKSFIPLIANQQSGRMNFGSKALEYSFVAPLKPGSDPKAVMDGMDAMMKPTAWAAFVNAIYGGDVIKLSWKRKDLTGTASFALGNPPKGLGMAQKQWNEARKALTNMFGSDKMTVQLAVANGRVVWTTDPGAKERVAALAGGTAPAVVQPEMQEIVNETRNDEGFMYFDLMGFVRPVLEAASATDPGAAQAKAMLTMMPGIDKLRVPLIMAYNGGKSLAVELRVPLRTFANVGKIVAPLRGMGMGGGMGGPPGAPPGGVITPSP